MAKLTFEDLRKLRESPDSPSGIDILVAMGTSGIAAGARATLAAFESELREHDLTSVRLRQTGSLGLDHAEPTVEVRMPDMPRVIYGKVTPEIAAKIVRKHVMGKSLINDHIYDRPAFDFVERKEQM